VPYVDRVVAIGFAAGENGISDEQVFRNHTRAVGLDVAGFAAQFFLHYVANHLEVLADAPSAHRSLEFTARPVRRVFTRQMTGHLVGGGFGLAELRAGEQSALSELRAGREKLRLFRIGPPRRRNSAKPGRVRA
jgi:hypothetical protein